MRGYSDYEQISDEELIDRLRNGEEQITDYICDKYKNLVRSKAKSMFILGGDNEDLIQEGMIGLFKAVRDYKEEKETSFFSFADLCISRQLYSALEASNRKKHQPLNTYISFSNQDGEEGMNLEEVVTDHNVSPEQMLIEQEGREEFFHRLKENLSSMERTVLYLYLEGNSYTQIAEIMSKSPKSIDNTLQRIRGKIKQMKE